MSIPQRVSSATPAPSGRKADINIASRDVTGLTQKLKVYHRTFSPLFFRKEQQHWSLKYMQGQMLKIERKAIEPMARALDGGNVQAMQQFVSVGAWKDEPGDFVHPPDRRRRNAGRTRWRGDSGRLRLSQAG